MNDQRRRLPIAHVAARGKFVVQLGLVPGRAFEVPLREPELLRGEVVRVFIETAVVVDQGNLRGTNSNTLTATNPADVTILIPNGSTWKYLDKGTDQGIGGGGGDGRIVPVARRLLVAGQ